MPTVSSDYRKILELAVTLVAALVVLSALRAPAQAQGSHMLVIPASDGYGFDDCLAAGNRSCGQVIADAYCEAHGMSASISFGRADDVTASVPTRPGAATATKLEAGAFIVNCRD